MTAHIQALPTDVVHHIAAGEVIDSLASVVRELVENALDAQATRLTISLWPEIGRVRVADDGMGMSYGDLRCAVLPHSTSKIRTQDDLWHIQSLGFRGQALHSLAQVATLEIWSRSRIDADALGWRMAYSEQGEPVEEETVAIAPGTIVIVSKLFATWPTRLQALPSTAQQLRATQLCLQQISLCHPQVTFQVELRDAPWFALAPSETAQQRLPQILKNVAVSDLRELNCPAILESGVSQKNDPEQKTSSPLGQLYLLIGLPDRCHRRRPDWIKVAINGRLVVLPEIEQTVMQAFRFTLPRDRHPVCFLHLQTSPNHIDWNRHPDKSEVYLHQLDTWISNISKAVSDLLRLHPDSLTQTGYNQRVSRLLKAAEPEGQYAASDPAPSNPADQVQTSGFPSKSYSIASLKAVAQVQQRYILAEHSSGICLIEQHIAHERVLYERLSQDWNLVPLSHPVILEHLSQTQVDNLQQLQIEIASFGHQLWAIRSAPAPLAKRSDLAEALLELSLSPTLEKALVATACR
ncbi:MAG TPA: DNA mismatch repair endonuclease MutL, partial [Leptolyngbyaceae cyanobacterium]